MIYPIRSLARREDFRIESSYLMRLTRQITFVTQHVACIIALHLDLLPTTDGRWLCIRAFGVAVYIGFVLNKQIINRSLRRRLYRAFKCIRLRDIFWSRKWVINLAHLSFSSASLGSIISMDIFHIWYRVRSQINTKCIDRVFATWVSLYIFNLWCWFFFG